MEFQLSYFKSWKMMLWSAAFNMPANLKNSAVATGQEKGNFLSNPKERQCQRMLKLPHNCTHLSSVQSSCSVVSDSLWLHIRPACPSPNHRVYSNSFPLSQWRQEMHSSHMPGKQCSKFSKLGFNSAWTKNFQMFKIDSEKAEKPEIKLSTSAES